ncbi:MAG: IS1380 family transposase [Planctomycetota bacterium]|nr:IS1380 family transposase [Planctomycetota bacterium]
MKREDRRNLRNRKRRIAWRLRPREWPERPYPMFAASNIQYEVSARQRGITAGGIGAIHLLARRVGLVRELDRVLHLLKRHLPYHESDHVLNLVYNIMYGNTRLEDLELLRQNESYLDMLGAQRIPDPTTAGDFLRRFTEADIVALLDAVNGIRRRVWMRLPREERKRAVIDGDGTDAPTDGEKKDGIGLSYKGVWGYSPLLISLANTSEPLFIVNRPGNVPSHTGAAEWFDKAIALCEGVFDEILLRGDTDFSLTANFDRWTDQNVKFVFGYDAHASLVALAKQLPEAAFRPLPRWPTYDIQTEPRQKRENVKEAIVKEKGFENIRLCSEEVAEFMYRPGKCRHAYRVIVLRKNLSVEKGEAVLFPDVRYFFYITNDPSMSSIEVVYQANERCNQENLIEQLKNGVNAMRVPVYDLVSNWAYMVIASLAWTLKAWFALTLPRAADREDVLRMEFKQFLNALIRVPCQIIKGGHRILLRLLGYTSCVRLLFASLGAVPRLNSG